jgi:hypothetical protein
MGGSNLDPDGLDYARQPDVVAKARQLLAEMEQTLARMQAEYAAAQERLAQAAVDEPKSRARHTYVDRRAR